MFSELRKIIYRIRKNKSKKYIENLKRKGLVVGENTEILEPFFLDPKHCFLISIGANCTLAPNVRLIAHDASTKKLLGYTRIGKIVIHDNCFIGDSTIILPNVTIGSNSIIGSATLVNKNIPANVVAVGNPVKVICSIEDYKDKIKMKASSKKIFGAEYLMRNITEDRMKEVLQSLDNDEGYII